MQMEKHKIEEAIHFIFSLSLIVILGACGNDVPAIGTLEPVPFENAGKTNPLSPDAATDGELFF